MFNPQHHLDGHYSGLHAPRAGHSGLVRAGGVLTISGSRSISRPIIPTADLESVISLPARGQLILPASIEAQRTEAVSLVSDVTEGLIILPGHHPALPLVQTVHCVVEVHGGEDCLPPAHNIHLIFIS